ncbi:MAG: hypothetical protein ACRDQI_12530, partial [Pseudonocardiaceae bacterium]
HTFHDPDLAFAHPASARHGQRGPRWPDAVFEAMLPKSGNWRVFLQFQTASVLHTAAVTLSAG